MQKATKRAEFMKQLSAAGIRPSAQRLAILEFISSCRCHPTADDIYSALAPTQPTLSRTTVFNCLRLLAGKGLLNDIDIASESTRYDSASLRPHAHFMCRECRKIFDIPFNMEAIPAPDDFQCDNVNVFFKGLCPECSKKKSDTTT